MKTIFAVAALALASLVPASAENIVNIDLPFSFSGIATPCTADSIDVTGTAHIVVHATADGAGGFHGGLHINVSASGTGTPSGAKYQGGAEANANLNLNAGGTEEISVEATARLIGQGKVQDLKLKIHFHATKM